MAYCIETGSKSCLHAVITFGMYFDSRQPKAKGKKLELNRHVVMPVCARFFL